MQIVPQRIWTAGECLLHGGYPVEAFPFIQADLARQPNQPGHWNNLGMCHKFTGDYAEAIAAFKKCLEIHPGIVQARHNLGMCYEETGRFREAVDEYATVCSWAPDENNIYALASCLLRERKYEKALEFWERARLGKSSAVYFPNIRPWRGERLVNRKIIVTREGGFGDILWLLRYLEPLKALGGHVTYQVHGPMKTLLDGHPFLDEVLADTEKVDDQVFDYQIPLWSLPWELRKLGVADVPMDAGTYIRVDAPEKAGGLNFGLAPYAGEVLTVHRKMRSIQPEFVNRFSQVPVTWTWLSGETAPDWCEASIVRGCSWLETAKVVAGLDAVVAVDSSISHLAGAMGKKTFLAVPLGSDWKFFYDQNQSSWYPTARLYRNQEAVSFEAVTDRIVADLQELVRNSSKTEELCEQKM